MAEKNIVKKSETTFLRVINFDYNKGICPGIRISGKWLQNLGWNVGDYVRVTATPTEIRVTKEKV